MKLLSINALVNVKTIYHSSSQRFICRTVRYFIAHAIHSIQICFITLVTARYNVANFQFIVSCLYFALKFERAISIQHSIRNETGVNR